MIDQDEVYMKLALAEAEKAFVLGEIPIGAVLVDGQGQVVTAGHNRRESWHDATAHAELIVIQAACRKLKKWRLSGLTLYVTIEPCPMCAGAIINSRIKRVVFGAYDPKAGSCGSVNNLFSFPYNHSPEVEGGFMQDECALLLKQFFAELRRTK